MKVLVLAPHCDDETLGCGGTIARLAQQGDQVEIAVLTGHGNDQPHPLWPRDIWDTVRQEAVRAWECLGVSAYHFREIPAVLVPDQPQWTVNRIVFDLFEETCPDVVFVPFAYDLHKDHRELFYAAAVAWRPVSRAGIGIRRVLAYETVSETHWNADTIEPAFRPNTWIDVTDTLHTKVEALGEYKSQMRPFPDARSIEAVEALARWRGSQIGARAAEAFVVVRSLEREGRIYL